MLSFDIALVLLLAFLAGYWAGRLQAFVNKDEM